MKEPCKKLKGIWQKTQGIWQKNSRIWKKTQGYEALSGLVGLKKVYKKQACFIGLFDFICLVNPLGCWIWIAWSHQKVCHFKCERSICLYMLLRLYMFPWAFCLCFICFFVFLCAFTCFDTLSYVFIRFWMLLYAIIRFHTLPYAFIHFHMLLYAFICFYMLLYALHAFHMI